MTILKIALYEFEINNNGLLEGAKYDGKEIPFPIVSKAIIRLGPRDVPSIEFHSIIPPLEFERARDVEKGKE